MAKALSVAALAALGAPRLAELLVEHSAGDPTLRKKLRLALAGSDGAERLAAEVDKRLRAIGRARSFVDWDRIKPLAQELDHLRTTIAGPLAERDRAAAVERMWALLGMAEGVIERTADGGGRVAGLFQEAVSDLGCLCAALPARDPVALARRACAMLAADRFGILDGLLPALGEALGAAGRAEARHRLQETIAALPAPRGREDGRVARERARAAWRLGQLADVEGDVDGFVAALELGGIARHHRPAIAQRLLAAGRAADALAWLDRALEGDPDPAATPLVDLRLAALEALGRKDEAQAARWDVFARWLSLPHLRDYLKRLPDFADDAAERRAVAHALQHPERNRALAFLIAWPRLEAADRLVRAELAALDARDHRTLRTAAEALAGKYPLAATLLYRRLVRDVLDRGASAQYDDAARDVGACARLAAALPDGAEGEGHAGFLAGLRQRHGRKQAFWQRLDARPRAG